MVPIIRWKRMKYGTGEIDPERCMGFLLFCVCSAEKTKGELTVTVNIERFHDEGFSDQWRTDGGC